EARRNLWRLARAALRGSGGSLFLDVSLTGGSAGLVRPLDTDLLVDGLTTYGGRLLVRHEGPGTDLFDVPDPATCRLQVDFPTGEPHA
ncbi:MAG: hypothetical protein HOQ22_15630, partial [Nocardioidaceae bacterium]|nr:hypothetical protein [Nocardioidaceae bacterium]